MSTNNSSTDLLSMTGFAVFEGKIGNKSYRAHLSSVNHRFFDLRWKTPKNWWAYESEARSFFKEKLQRGSLECWIEEIPGTDNNQNSELKTFFEKLHEAINTSSGIFSQLSFPLPVRALVLSRFPDLWWHKKQEDGSLPEADVKNLLLKLAQELQTKRREEGTKIKQELKLFLKILEELRIKIEKVQEACRKEWEEQYRQRLKDLTEQMNAKEISEERLIQEYLVLSEKRDIAEELQRISMHLQATRDLIENPKENIGKRLEFLTQELHREWTTMGNKVRNANVAQDIIEAKLAIEKIKEQSFNIA